MTFDELELNFDLQRAVADCGYTEPTAIQVQAIPHVLDGRDVLACAQTGTGKTAAFALPVLHGLQQMPTGRGRPVRALVLSPTRELASQIEEAFRRYSVHLDCRVLCVTGGEDYAPQVMALRYGIDLLIATPGRLLDLVERGEVDLGRVAFFVLDEADRMLDMGFIQDVRRVLPLLPPRRQNLLFSATLPPGISDLSGDFMRDPVRVSVTPDAPVVEAIRQILYYVERGDKTHLLTHLLEDPEVERSIVFVKTKHGADHLLKKLHRGGAQVAAIHGNKSQGARRRALELFREGEIDVLVATDVAARGIDVEGVSHVFQFDLPHEAEAYVHRIGRTGRAGRAGVAITFCDSTEAEALRNVERLTGRPLRVEFEHEWHSLEAMTLRADADRRKGRHNRRQPGGGHGGSSRGRGGRNRGGRHGRR